MAELRETPAPSLLMIDEDGDMPVRAVASLPSADVGLRFVAALDGPRVDGLMSKGASRLA
jgi:hypothetical protein